MSAVKVRRADDHPVRGIGCHEDGRAWVEAELKDVGDQALMRGLATAFPIVRPGLFLSYCGRRRFAGHKASDGHSPAVVPPPPMREMCAVAAGDQVARASLATAHMKPTSSRAIAVQTTVVRLPRVLSMR